MFFADDMLCMDGVWAASSGLRPQFVSHKFRIRALLEKYRRTNCFLERQLVISFYQILLQITFQIKKI